MNNLFLVTSQEFLTKGSSENRSYELLVAAASARSLNVQTVPFEDFDFSEHHALSSEDGIYRISTNKKAALVETYLLRPEAASFYVNGIGRINSGVGSSLIHYKAGLPIIETIFSLTKDKDLLKTHVEKLGGFPIIIKAMGGTHGVGVMRCDSFEALTSLVDYLTNQNGTYILRKYIDYTTHARLIVVGDQVVGSIEYERIADDFRSNAGDALSTKPMTFSPEIQRIAVEATRTIGLEFGGVDILIDNTGAPYIAEVNFPCYFPRTQEATGIDIAGHMLDHLIKKSKS